MQIRLPSRIMVLPRRLLVLALFLFVFLFFLKGYGREYSSKTNDSWSSSSGSSSLFSPKRSTSNRNSTESSGVCFELSVVVLSIGTEVDDVESEVVGIFVVVLDILVSSGVYVFSCVFHLQPVKTVKGPTSVWHLHVLAKTSLLIK